MRETYRAKFKELVKDPFDEFVAKMKSAEHAKATAERVEQSIADLQLQTGLSGLRRHNIIQSVRDGVDEISRK